MVNLTCERARASRYIQPAMQERLTPIHWGNAAFDLHRRAAVLRKECFARTVAIQKTLEEGILLRAAIRRLARFGKWTITDVG